MNLNNQLNTKVGLVSALVYNAILFWILFVPDLDGNNYIWVWFVGSGIAFISSLLIRYVKVVRDFYMIKGYDEKSVISSLNVPVIIWSLLFPAGIILLFAL